MYRHAHNEWRKGLVQAKPAVVPMFKGQQIECPSTSSKSRPGEEIKENCKEP